MERITKFQVGDKVIYDTKVGTITKITPKRKDITVDFEGYTMTFWFDGWTHGDAWNMKHIEKWTPEKQKIIDDKMAIYKCKKMFEDTAMKNKLTPDMARKIIGVFA